MANEYKLSYTGSEINEKLGKIDELEDAVNELSGAVKIYTSLNDLGLEAETVTMNAILSAMVAPSNLQVQTNSSWASDVLPAAMGVLEIVKMHANRIAITFITSGSATPKMWVGSTSASNTFNKWTCSTDTYFGTNIIIGDNDTPSTWKTYGTGYAYYNTANLITNQPSTYGFLNQLVEGANVYQEWLQMPAGNIYKRSGNANGWNSSWKELATTDYALPRDGSAKMTDALTIDRSNGTLGVTKVFKHNASGTDYGSQFRDEDKDGNVAALVVRATSQKALFFPDGSASREMLHAGNYSDYALPLTGGTITGALAVKPSTTSVQVTADSSTATISSYVDWSKRRFISIPSETASSPFNKLQYVDMNADGNGNSTRYNILHTGNMSEFGCAKIQTGNYVGTGTSGSSSPNSLTFDFEPKMVFITPETRNSGNALLSTAWVIFTQTDMMGYSYANTTFGGGNYLRMTPNWGKTLRWWSTYDAGSQGNTSGATYRYWAFG